MNYVQKIIARGVICTHVPELSRLDVPSLSYGLLIPRNDRFERRRDSYSYYSKSKTDDILGAVVRTRIQVGGCGFDSHDLIQL